MTHVDTQSTGARDPQAIHHCGFCGVKVNDAESTTERFGEAFCSEAHAEAFVREVKAARIRTIAAQVMPTAPPGPGRVIDGAACAHGDGPAARPRTRRWLTWACWGTPLLLLLALPLLTSGGSVATAAGSVLSVLAVLACPLAMLLMMRGMGGMGYGGDTGEAGKGPTEKKEV